MDFPDSIISGPHPLYFLYSNFLNFNKVKVALLWSKWILSLGPDSILPDLCSLPVTVCLASAISPDHFIVRHWFHVHTHSPRLGSVSSLRGFMALSPSITLAVSTLYSCGAHLSPPGSASSKSQYSQVTNT